MKNNIHIVFAHPRLGSLNFAMKEACFQSLKGSHEVSVSNLYEMHKQNHPATKPYGMEQSKEDLIQIKEEQEKVAQSNLTVIQFPMYWFSFPSIVKAYWEQMMTPGFAYPGKFKQSPLYDGRKVLFSLTTNSNEQDYSDQGEMGSLDKVMHHLFVAFRFAGFNILEPFVAYNVAVKNTEEITVIISKFKEHLAHIVDNPKIWQEV